MIAIILITKFEKCLMTYWAFVQWLILTKTFSKSTKHV